MAVTELALLHLAPGLTIDDPHLLAKLREAQKAAKDYTGGKVLHFYSQVEDPSYFYVLAGWDYPTQLLDSWTPSPEHPNIRALLKDFAASEWLFLVPIPIDEINLSSPVLAIARHFISSHNKVSFSEMLEENKHYVDDFTTPANLVGGWRVEEEADDKEEWVHFTGWNDVAQHYAFAESAGFKEYAKIKPFVDEFDIKHATPLKLE